MKVNGFNGVLFSYLNKMKPEEKVMFGKRKSWKYSNPNNSIFKHL